MTILNEILEPEKNILEECGEAEARWPLCFSIVKQYPIEKMGGIDWGEGEVISNEDDPILMCDKCAKNNET